MSSIFYKVIFKASNENENNSFSLTFRNLITSKPIYIPSRYFSALKELSKENKDIINFQNIQEVIKIGEDGFNYIFNYYIVLLFTYIHDRKKQGFLIGNAKNLGDILIGIWPFNQKQLNFTSSNIVELFDDLIKKSDFEKISIIYS
jgi:hypothetical protein